MDVDPQAVEVTNLSLFLKVLEGESEQTIAKQLKLFHLPIEIASFDEGAAATYGIIRSQEENEPPALQTCHIIQI